MGRFVVMIGQNSEPTAADRACGGLTGLAWPIKAAIATVYETEYVDDDAPSDCGRFGALYVRRCWLLPKEEVRL
ncbi:hypothetical protein E9531_09120 [Lampropedia puyangensis]|uniref:Uncharacterized protein n=1 Tax=Lampropedia puyangensis TaxID=1330072 RepID=A0A4S8F4T8_9BURK|nr:hypothetical protein [Lampropedia puyangensis]THU01515.1 hypothetical protein E9531_09120 [Lampropedia puyangensis]